MRTLILAATALSAVVLSVAAQAQSAISDFRGFRIEGNAGGDRFQAEGRHRNKFGYGGTAGFDGVLLGKIVVGPEGSYWRPEKRSEVCQDGINGGTVCSRSSYEIGAAVRAGYLLTPSLLVFGKGGWARDRQVKQFDAPSGLYYVDGQIVGPETSYRLHGHTDGYQVGGGVEYSLTAMSLPLYVSGQYVYTNYENHTSRQRAMLGVGLRFK